MENIFDKIVKTIPKPSPDAVAKLNQLNAEQSKPPATAGSTTDYDKMDPRDLVIMWQKNSSPELTSAVLRKFEPTMKSALHSYAPGSEDGLRIQAAKLALKSLKAYDPKAGTSPSTYMFSNLQRLNRISASRASMIKYPEQAVFDRNKLLAAQARFEDDHNREASIGELADITGMSQKKILKLLDMKGELSASATINPETNAETVGYKDTTPDDYYDYVYNSVSPIDQKIMDWTSGRGGKILSNSEIAQKLHISPPAVSQRKANIQKKLSEVSSLL